MQFFKSTILLGLYILLPVTLLWIGLKEIGGLLVAMATPIADMFPSTYFDHLKWPGIVAIALLAAASLGVGLLARIKPIAYLANLLEERILARVPMYRMLKIISGSLVMSGSEGVVPALITDKEGGGDPCYIMERHANGLATVLLPWSPASFAGGIKVVPASKLQTLDCSLDEFSRSISFMGVGVEDCLSTTGGNVQTDG